MAYAAGAFVLRGFKAVDHCKQQNPHADFMYVLVDERCYYLETFALMIRAWPLHNGLNVVIC